MLDKVKVFLNKVIFKPVAGIVGVVEVIIPFVRELLVLATRICATVIPGEKDDEIIAKIVEIFDKFEDVFEKAKDGLLKLGVE